MTPSQAFRDYLKTLEQKLATGGATEHTHRAALEGLIESLDRGITAINEPTHIACGAPDLAQNQIYVSLKHNIAALFEANGLQHNELVQSLTIPYR